MTARHTPGPWEAVTTRSKEGEQITRVKQADPPGGWGPTVADCTCSDFESVDAANAQLIAAAPDLADALERMLVHHGETCHNLNCPLGIHAAAALKKAGRLR